MNDCIISDGMCLKYRESGSGPAVLLLHGWAGGSWYFDSLIKRLSGNYRCIAPDFKGHGESDKPDQSEYSVSALACETRELIDALGLEELAIVGHSMGGGVAQRLFLDYGDGLKIKGLALLSCGGGSASPSKQIQRIVQGMRRNVERIGSHASRGLALKVARAGCAPEFAASRPEMIELVVDEAEKVPVQARLDLFEDLVLRYHTLERAAEIESPCLCVCGTRDSLLEDSRKLSEVLPDAEFVRLDGAGHMINWEREEIVGDIIEEFLKKIF